MDEARRKENDKAYDWWSAEGHHKLIQITPTKRAIVMSCRWHEYFFWKPIDEQVHRIPLFGTYSAARAMYWSKNSFYDVFLKQVFAPYSGWCKDANQYSDAQMYEENVGYTIMYERIVDSPYLKELGELQDECEDLVGRIWVCLRNIEEAEEKLCKFFAFGKSEARKEKEEAERKLPPLREQLDQHLARVNEIRAIILGS